MIDIINPAFITSSPNLKLCPPEDMSEVAFMGRSNVGKSSILNSLTKRKSLAKSSATPGKTRLINFFSVEFKTPEEERFHARFVDLPGFGYAKVSKSIKEEWNKSLTDFIKNRTAIRLFIHLVDARHPNLKIDDEVFAYLQEIKRPDQEILQVFTKVDKLKQKELSKLKKEYPNSIMVSNLKNKGVSALTTKIYHSLFAPYEAL